MPPTILQIILLGLVQGAAELLPVSSSAHVIVAEKLMRLDPASPEMSFLLVMLHTGTMFAVTAYFWRSWRKNFFSSRTRFIEALRNVAAASAGTVLVYLVLKLLIEKVALGGGKAEIERLFSSLPLIAGALFAAGALILGSAFANRKRTDGSDVTAPAAVWIGLVQGVCVPFRGFSRSGSTISVGLLAGVGRRQAEEFSFALALVITPAAIAQEFLRLRHAQAATNSPLHWLALVQPGLLGMAASFLAGLLALAWLSRWLETGHWRNFGYYCIGAAAVIIILAAYGF